MPHCRAYCEPMSIVHRRLEAICAARPRPFVSLELGTARGKQLATAAFCSRQHCPRFGDTSRLLELPSANTGLANVCMYCRGWLGPRLFYHYLPPAALFVSVDGWCCLRHVRYGWVRDCLAPVVTCAGAQLRSCLVRHIAGTAEALTCPPFAVRPTSRHIEQPKCQFWTYFDVYLLQLVIVT